MATLELPVRSDLPAFTFRQELEGSVYTLGFRFNERIAQWIMDILSEQEVPIVMGIPVLTEVEMTERFKYLSIPQGYFVCIDETGKQRNPDRDTFGDEVKLLYVESTEEF